MQWMVMSQMRCVKADLMDGCYEWVLMRAAISRGVVSVGSKSTMAWWENGGAVRGVVQATMGTQDVSLWVVADEAL